MSFTLTLGHVLAAIVAAAGGGGTLGALVALGAFHRWLKPAIRAEILLYEGEAAVVEARKVAIRVVLDDQIARDDGVIRRHTRAHEDRISEAIDAVRESTSAMVEEMAQFRGVLGVLVERMPSPPTRNSPTHPAPGFGPPRRPTPPHGTHR